MERVNKLLLRQAKKYLGGLEGLPENFSAFMEAVNDSYHHYEKDHILLERSIELSSAEMIELTEHVKNESRELKKAHEELKATENIRLEKRLDEEKITKLQEITQVVIEVQERERAYLAAELHDNINQILATTRLYIDTAIKDEAVRLSFITESKEFINSAMEEIRSLCKSLLPPLLSQTSLISALEDLIENIKVANNLVITTDWSNIDESLLCEKKKLSVFRIIQEQLNNIFKHAQAHAVKIQLRQCVNTLQLIIKDDGVGFDLSKKRKGVGLQNIVSRANLLNGEVVINTAPGKGCELIVSFCKDENQLINS